MAGQTKRERFDKNYFALPNTIIVINHIIIYIFMIIVIYDPTIVPPSLGFIRTAHLYVAEHYRSFCVYWLWFFFIAHTGEALYCYKTCRDAGMSSSATIKWMLSTLFLGSFSLLQGLKAYLKRFKED